MPHEREQRFGVRTETVRRTPLTRTVRTVGVVREDERRQSTVRVKWDGWIEALHVQFVGETVREGQPLFTVYSPDLVVSQQEFVNARKRLERARAAAATDSGEAEAAQALADAAGAKLRAWDVPEAHLERIARTGVAERLVTLVAPRGGTVLERPARPGLHVEPETDLYSIADLSQVWVVADLYEYEAPLVTVGTEGRFESLGPERSEIGVRVAFVSPIVDPMSRTVKVRCDVPNPDGRLRPGAFGTLRLSLPLGEVLSVPTDAVIDTGERRVAFVRTGVGVFEPRRVTLGSRAGDRAEVVGGLEEGDEVVVRGQFLLDAESRLRAAGTGQPGHGGHGP